MVSLTNHDKAKDQTPNYKLKKMKHIFFLALLCPFLSNCQPLSLKGNIINEDGQPVPNATITVKRPQPLNTSTSQPSTLIYQLSSAPNGEFTLTDLHFDDTLIISAVGYTTTTEIFDYTLQGHDLTIVLKRKTTALDDVVIIAYGATTKRLNTSTISTLTSSQIANQPVSNPLSALQGRIPGLIITQLNGLPGSNFTVQLRGRNSIQQGTDPLYIIDGVPFASDALSQRSGSLNASSPFSSLPPSDIESIEVLKDADATAIYGSRGANGVILITTKKGKAGATSLDLDYYTALATPAKTPLWLNTRQYLQMRREAYANDGTSPTLANGPDLLVWDSLAYTDFANTLIGSTAHTNNASLRLHGGSANTSFSFGLACNKQTTVFPSAAGDTRYSSLLNLRHAAADNRFNASLSLNYAWETNNLPLSDLTQNLTLAPNLPPLYDSLGKLSWSYGGTQFTNPLGLLLKEFSGTTNRLNANAVLSWSLAKSLVFSASLGYNYLRYEEYTATPIISQSPSSAPKGSATFASNGNSSWIVEPQLRFKRNIAKGLLEALIGASFQKTANGSSVLSGSGYTSDALLGAISGAASFTASNAASLYKYSAAFGRINYNWAGKYIINLTGRYDGSSRFGPGKQFAPFGAVGAAWVFTGENFFKQHSPFLTYGKLRGSYGITGNDQIGNYGYLDSWGNTQYPFGGSAAILPLRLFNDQYSWEKNRKLEAALELGFWDRVFITVNAFRNRSSNQLISYNLPAQTGFTTIIKNFPGLVQNKGIELELTATLVSQEHLRWETNFNYTATRNALLSFPGLDKSSYANTYRIGRPLSIRLGYHYTGIDPQTGIYTFEDVSKDGLLSSLDYVDGGTADPLYYGGFGSDLSFRGISFSFFFQYVNALGRNPVLAGASAPGLMLNRPVEVLDHWQHPGDVTTYQKFTAATTSPAGQAASRMALSDGILTDASFVRLKNVSLGYAVAPSRLQHCHLKTLRFYIEAQNLFTITKYPIADPENQSLTSLPPLQTLAAGIQITL
jgi:TonB-linked SusC/RagA family outer membrane protein